MLRPQFALLRGFDQSVGERIANRDSQLLYDIDVDDPRHVIDDALQSLSD